MRTWRSAAERDMMEKSYGCPKSTKPKTINLGSKVGETLLPMKLMMSESKMYSSSLSPHTTLIRGHHRGNLMPFTKRTRPSSITTLYVKYANHASSTPKHHFNTEKSTHITAVSSASGPGYHQLIIFSITDFLSPIIT